MNCFSSQEERIEAHLLAGNYLTPLEALNLFGCFRLGARIYGLRKRHTIRMENYCDPQTGKHYARYTLVHAGVQQALLLPAAD